MPNQIYTVQMIFLTVSRLTKELYLLFKRSDITRSSDTEVSWINIFHPEAVSRTIKHTYDI